MVQDMNEKLLKRIHHDIDWKCNIAIFSDWSCENDWQMFPDERHSYDKFYSGKEFYEIANHHRTNGNEDIYFSINSFRHPKKKEKDVWHLNAIALDFDYYKLQEYKGLDAKSMYETHLKEKLPFIPSAVVDSGQGLYIIYIVKHSPKAMTSTYKAIYKSFLKDFQKYGLDSNAMKVTQVIRIPGTINTKTLNTVEVLELNDTDYTLRDFFTMLPYSREEAKQKQRKKKKEYIEYDFNQLMKSNKFRKSFVADYIRDLQTYIKIRNAAGEKEGHRELVLYLARRRMRWQGATPDEELHIALALNELFINPLREKEVIINTAPAGKTKCPGIARTIELLEITTLEQSKMKVICAKGIKDAYKNKRRRKHPLLNRTKTELQKLKRQAEVLKRKEAGMRNIDIARELNVDKSTITRDLQEIRAHPSLWKKTMKELFIEFKEYIKTDLFIRQTIYRKQVETLEWLKTCEAVLE